MEKKDFFISGSDIEYNISKHEISNRFDEIHEISETPSVFYLNIKYEDEIYLPVTIFQNKLTPLQIIVKYLRENLNKTNKQVSLLLNRSPKTTWLTYKAIEKKKRLVVRETQLQIPLGIFRDRTLSTLETLVHFLNGLEMKYSEISRLLNKDQRTIWTVHSRAKKKLNQDEYKK